MKQNKRFRRITLAGILFILVLTLVLYLSDIAVSVDLAAKDYLLLAEHRIDPRIILIGIDEDSLKTVGPWRWPRTVFADLISKISAGNPAAIGMDVLFSEPSANPDEDKALADAIEKSGKVVLVAAADFPRKTTAKSGEILKARSLTLPLQQFRKYSVTGHMNVIPDLADGVVRKSLNKIQFAGKTYDSFDSALFNMAAPVLGLSTDIKSINQDDLFMSNIDFVGDPGGYGYISVYRVLNGEVKPEFFRDSIVIVGPVASGIVDDYYTTPLSRQSQMTGMEIHANIVQNFIDNSFKKDSFWLNLLVILLFGISISLAARLLNPVFSAGGLALLTICYIFVAKAVYSGGTILTLFYPVLGGLLIYLFILVVKYIEDYLERKRITEVFGKYVAPEVVNQILILGEKGLRLGGARRDVTVLFVDVRGFTPLSEKTQPEELVAILNEYLTLTARSIFHHGGTLDKFIGDATMAVFNAPLDLPDHQMAAVLTALEMKQGTEALNAKLQERFGLMLSFGIGIHTGPAVVGNIGADFRMDYTAIGDTVNTAARLESNAKAGEILISPAMTEALDGQILTEPKGMLKLKGKEQEMAVYSVLGRNHS